jgi:hypothetical protein
MRKKIISIFLVSLLIITGVSIVSAKEITEKSKGNRGITGPHLTLTLSEWNFGEVVIGQSASKIFKLENDGDARAWYTLWTDDEFDYYSIGVEGSFQMEPGHVTYIPCTFRPGTEGGPYPMIIHVDGWESYGTNDQSASVTGKGKKDCCFPAGTKITMADGSYKNIENIKPGELILSYNIYSDQYSKWPVFVTSQPIHPVYEINDGLLSLTKEHPLLMKKMDGTTGWGAIIPDRSVVRFGGKGLTLQQGDQIFTSDKKWIEVTKITYKSEPVQTYNIVSFWGKQNFFANDILVFEEHGSIPYLMKMYFGKVIDRFPNAFPVLQHMMGY